MFDSIKASFVNHVNETEDHLHSVLCYHSSYIILLPICGQAVATQ